MEKCLIRNTSRASLLKNVQAGDKIRFRAETVAGAFVVTDIQPVK